MKHIIKLDELDSIIKVDDGDDIIKAHKSFTRVGDWS